MIKKEQTLKLCKAWNQHHKKDYVVRDIGKRFKNLTNAPYIITYRINSMFNKYPIVTE